MGTLEVVPGSDEDGAARVEVVVVYADEAKLKERVKIFKMDDPVDGRVGVDVLVGSTSLLASPSQSEREIRTRRSPN